MLKRVSLLFTALLLIIGAAYAQDDTSTDTDTEATPEAQVETEVLDTVTSTPPTIVSITPDTVTLDGAGLFTVTVTYDDVEQDAYAFLWRMVETNAEYWALADGIFDQQTAGTEIDVTFRCYQPQFEATIELTVLDLMGNRSEPALITMTCSGDEGTVAIGTDLDATGAQGEDAETTDTGAQVEVEADAVVAPGSAPSVVSITPPSVDLRRDSEAFATVTYEDPDGDATQFLWLLNDTNAITYTLPRGAFDQQSVGTEIPVRFFCTTTPFYMDLSLVIVDAMGNTSEPFPFEVTCR